MIYYNVLKGVIYYHVLKGVIYYHLLKGVIYYHVLKGVFYYHVLKGVFYYHVLRGVNYAHVLKGVINDHGIFLITDQWGSGHSLATTVLWAIDSILLVFLIYLFNRLYTVNQIDFSTIELYTRRQQYSDVTSVNSVFVSKKIVNNSANFRIKCLSYSKINAILCVLCFLFLHFFFI